MQVEYQKEKKEKKEQIVEVVIDKKNLSKLLTDNKPPIQEPQETPNWINTK